MVQKWFFWAVLGLESVKNSGWTNVKENLMFSSIFLFYSSNQIFQKDFC